MEIKFEELENKGRAYAVIDEKEIGEMTFSKTNEHLIIIDHTGVNSEYRNHGVAKKLLDRVVDYARQGEIKIIPLCPYAKVMFERDTSIDDVLYQDNSK